MSKIKESELKNFVKQFESKNVIEIEFNENLEGKIKVEEATIKFDYKNGFLIIEGKMLNRRPSIEELKKFVNSLKISAAYSSAS